MAKSSVTPEKWEEALALRAAGFTAAAIGRQPGMPSHGALARYRDKDPKRQAEWSAATEDWREVLLDKVLNPQQLSADPQQQRVITDNAKWVLARMFRAEFGDKVEHQHTGQIDLRAVATEVSERLRVSDGGADTQARAPEHYQAVPKVIDAEWTEGARPMCDQEAKPDSEGVDIFS